MELSDVKMKIKILIIDDDIEANRLLSSYLRGFGFETFSAVRASLGLELVLNEKPTMIILDIMLPDKNGIDVCREIRRRSNVPIIMVTARGELGDRIQGLESDHANKF